MKKTVFRKAALSGCMFLTVWSGVPLGAFEARAQSNGGSVGNSSTWTQPSNTGTAGNASSTTTPGTELYSPQSIVFPSLAQALQGINSNTTQPGWPIVSALQQGGTPNQIISALQQGNSTSQITSAIANATGIPANTISSISSMVSNIANGQNLNPSSVATLLNNVTNGQIPTQLGQVLSTVSNLGNITSVTGITNLLQSSGITSALNGLTGGALGRGLDSVLNTALRGGNIQQALTTAGVNAITSTLARQFPQLASALGATGLTNAVTSALTSIMGGQASSALTSAATAAAGGASGGGGGSSGTCSPQGCGTACQQCHTDIPQHYATVRAQITSEINRHQSWFLTTYWRQHILPALMLMAEQLSVAGIAQVNMFGAILDAKHQLETQRLFQTLQAEAHKDYQPSEGMCTFGTTVRSLASSERRSNLSQAAFASRMMQRQTLGGYNSAVEGEDSDLRSRLAIYTSTYCDQADNANGLGTLCRTAVPTPARRNIDVDYTRNIESRLTLDIDFLQAPTSTGGAGSASTVRQDEQDVFALASNLYSHNIAPKITPEDFGSSDGQIRQNVAEKYMDLRAIFAKRSVAQNSFAAITSMRASGDPESAPYTKALIRELGVQDQQEIERFLGTNPSYFAQMELLTKKIYQNPVFYTELYDKPANVQRKGAALQAIGLMQDRDLYNSLLRSEAVLSVLLETMLQREQEKVTNAMRTNNPQGGSR